MRILIVLILVVNEIFLDNVYQLIIGKELKYGGIHLTVTKLISLLQCCFNLFENKTV